MWELGRLSIGKTPCPNCENGLGKKEGKGRVSKNSRMVKWEKMGWIRVGKDEPKNSKKWMDKVVEKNGILLGKNEDGPEQSWNGKLKERESLMGSPKKTQIW
jgi:hypothetical protein